MSIFYYEKLRYYQQWHWNWLNSVVGYAELNSASSTLKNIEIVSFVTLKDSYLTDIWSQEF